MSPEERAAAAEQLAELSDLLSPTSLELGDRLDAAAQAMAGTGDPGDALASAAAAASAAEDRAAAADSAAAARTTVRDLQSRLGDARDAGEGQGRGAGRR